MFNYHRRQDGPQIRALILHLLGFAVVILIGINPNEAQIGDVAVEIIHNGFYTHTQVWVKIRNGTRGWESTSELQRQYHYTSYFA